MMMRCLRWLSAGMVLLLALGVAAWALGRVTTDRWEWSQWLWWMPTPVALAAALLGVLVLLVRRLWLKGSTAALLVGGAIALLLGLYFVTVEHRMLSRKRQDADGVLVMHWNWTFAPRREVGRHVDIIIAEQPDVAVITHGHGLWRSPEERQRLEATWDVKPVSIFAVVSRWPILRARPIVSNDTTHIALVEIDATEALGETLTLLLVDLPSDLDIGRMDHMRQVRSMMVSSGVTSVDIALGDFNTTRGSASISTLLPGMHHAFDEGGHGYGATYHRELPLFHIDHILLSDDLRALDYLIIDPGFGRHAAQAARISARKPLR